MTAMAIVAAVSSAQAGVFPTLDKIKSGPGRFKTALNGQAALDKETGLVWELAPSTDEPNWFEAVQQCFTKEIGGRFGWRVPALEELASLLTRNGAGKIDLPFGHPFMNIDGAFFSSTADVDNPGYRYAVGLGQGLFLASLWAGADDNARVWCVRGGRGNNLPSIDE
jgi:hypothetical protein